MKHAFPLARFAMMSGAMVVLASVASAQAPRAPRYSAEFDRPYGWAYGSENGEYEVSTRDASGNRVIINGLMGTGSTLPTGLNGGVSAGGQYTGSISGLAVGNQLNVVVQGTNNTVVIDNTQINNGNQTVKLDANF